MLRTIVFCSLVLACVQTAMAGPIRLGDLDSDDMAWFYNRPGITLTQLQADTDACRDFAKTLQGGDDPILEWARPRAEFAAAVDDCMIARGYRRFTTTDHNLRTFLKRYETLSEDARHALASSEQPPDGTLSRQWSNDYWSVDETRDVRRPPIELRPWHVREIIPRGVLYPVDLSTPVTLAANQALLMFSIQSDKERRGPLGWDQLGGVVEFSRDDPRTGFPTLVPMRADRDLRWPIVSGRWQGRGRDFGGEPKELAFVVPAGHYSLAGVGWTVGTDVDFCMVTPAFNVEPGAVLHLGNYAVHLGNDRIKPMRLFESTTVRVRVDAVDLAGPRARLAASPELASRLAPVQYRNGFVRPCTDIHLNYGFDIPGVPWISTDESQASAVRQH